MTIPATRRDELRRLVEDSKRLWDGPWVNDEFPRLQELRTKLSRAVPDLLDEIERREAEVTAADERMAGVLDGTFSVGDGTAQREIERLRTELGEAKLVIEQQDRDLEKLRTALTDALACWRYPCLTAREKERKDEILAMLDE